MSNFSGHYRTLSFVPRWGIVRLIKGQSVAEHSYYVALYAMEIAKEMRYDGDVWGLMEYALKHDRNEVFTTDIPHPVKHYGIEPERMKTYEAKTEKIYFKDVLPVLDEMGMNIVKSADCLDAFSFLDAEFRSGNRGLKTLRDEMFALFQASLSEFCHPTVVSRITDKVLQLSEEGSQSGHPNFDVNIVKTKTD